MESSSSSQDPYLLSQAFITNNLRKLQEKHQYHNHKAPKIFRTEQKVSEHIYSDRFSTRKPSKSFCQNELESVISSESKLRERQRYESAKNKEQDSTGFLENSEEITWVD